MTSLRLSWPSRARVWPVVALVALRGTAPERAYSHPQPPLRETIVKLSGNAVTVEDVTRMTGKLWILEGEDRRKKSSAFWVLLVLAAVIATAGVIADSTATVIGAMIVAPLMTPILGSALALVLARRRQLVLNVAMVLGRCACGDRGGLSARSRPCVPHHRRQQQPGRRTGQPTTDRSSRGAWPPARSVRSPWFAPTSPTPSPVSPSPSHWSHHSRSSASPSSPARPLRHSERCCCSGPTSRPSSPPAPSCWCSSNCVGQRTQPASRSAS